MGTIYRSNRLTAQANLSVKPVTGRDLIGSVPAKEDVKQDAERELPTTERFRARMKAARQAAKMSQATLGEAVGLAQPMISDLETGVVGGSGRIMAICQVLHIPPPFLLDDPELEKFVEQAYELRTINPESFQAAKVMVENLLKAEQRSARSGPKDRSR